MITGVTYHPRSTWEDPKLPVNDPGKYTPPRHNHGLVDTIVFHYTAADNLIDGDPGEHASNLPAYLRAIQRDYRQRHEFSIGYSWAIDWLGGVWELRGWEYRPAATGGRLTTATNFNAQTFAILCLVDGNDPLTDLALDSARKVVRSIEARCSRTMRLGPHSQFDPTGCCGDGIRAQLAAGLLRAAPTPPKVEEPMPPASPVNRPPLARALEGAALVAEYLACNPGGGAQAAFHDTVLPWMTGQHIPAGDQRRTEAEAAARNPGGGRWARAWAAYIAGAKV